VLPPRLPCRFNSVKSWAASRSNRPPTLLLFLRPTSMLVVRFTTNFVKIRPLVQIILFPKFLSLSSRYRAPAFFVASWRLGQIIFRARHHFIQNAKISCLSLSYDLFPSHIRRSFFLRLLFSAQSLNLIRQICHSRHPVKLHHRLCDKYGADADEHFWLLRWPECR
jgi:hypothetical protein